MVQHIAHVEDKRRLGAARCLQRAVRSRIARRWVARLRERKQEERRLAAAAVVAAAEAAVLAKAEREAVARRKQERKAAARVQRHAAALAAEQAKRESTAELRRRTKEGRELRKKKRSLQRAALEKAKTMLPSWAETEEINQLAEELFRQNAPQALRQQAAPRTLSEPLPAIVRTDSCVASMAEVADFRSRSAPMPDTQLTSTWRTCSDFGRGVLGSRSSSRASAAPPGSPGSAAPPSSPAGEPPPASPPRSPVDLPDLIMLRPTTRRTMSGNLMESVKAAKDAEAAKEVQWAPEGWSGNGPLPLEGGFEEEVEAEYNPARRIRVCGCPLFRLKSVLPCHTCGYKPVLSMPTCRRCYCYCCCCCCCLLPAFSLCPPTVLMLRALPFHSRAGAQ